MAASPITIHLIGAPRVIDSDGNELSIPVGKPLALLAYLHLRDEPVSRSDLAELFWPDPSPRKARASLRQALWLLRRSLGDDIFLSDDPVRIERGQVTSDLRQLTANPAALDPSEAAELWASPPFRNLLLPDLPNWQRWTDRIRTEAEQVLASSLLERAEAATRPERRLEFFEAAARIQPYRPSACLAFLEELIAIRDFEQAEVEILRAREAFPEDPSMLEELEDRSASLQQLRRKPFESSDGPHTLRLEFVGRTEEYSALVHAWRAARAGQPQRVLITGDAGIGKSRLASQVTGHAETEGARTVQVKAEDGEEGLDWSFLNEVLRRLLRLSGAAGIGRDSDRILRTLLPGLGANGTGGSAPADPGPVILGEPTGAAIAEALHDLIAAVTDDGPLVLSLDDLHWADPKSRSVILRTIRRLTREPLLALLTCRSGIEDARLTRSLRLLSEGEAFQRIDLSPLSEAEVREAVSLLADFSDEDRADPILTRLYDLSRGNPLFLVEVLQTLAERGVLEPDDEGGWTLQVDRFPDDLPLPTSVRELLHRKLNGLSDEGCRVVEELVRARHPLSPRVLQQRSELESAAFTEALHEVVERGILGWTTDDTLGFSHDEMQAAARERLGSSTEPRRRRRIAWPVWWVGSAAVIFLVWFATSTLLGPLADDGPPVPPGGGGSIFLVFEDGTMEVVPDVTPASEWEVTPLDDPQLRQATVDGVHPLADGRLAWFIRGATVEDPPWITMRTSPDSAATVVRTEGDDFFSDVFPDGRSIIHNSEDRNAPVYSRDLYRTDLETGSSTLLLSRFGFRISARVSPDGRRIAATTADSLFILSPHGDLLDSFPLEGTGQLRWCGHTDELLHLTVHPEGSALQRWNPWAGRTEPLELEGLPGNHFDCSPDGRYLVYSAISDGGIAHAVRDLETGETEFLDLPTDRTAKVFWNRAEATPVPRALELPGDPPLAGPVRLSWGEILALEPTLRYSDGSSTPVRAEFESDQPAVASVTGNGRIFANSPGRVTIHATWDGWLHTTLEVEVEREERRGTLMEDRFEVLDPDRWQLVGVPSPTPERLDGEPVLRLRGDGRYTDGIIQRTPQPLTGGATAELEFRLPLSRVDRQTLRLCLMEGDVPDSPGAPVEWYDLSLQQRVCFRYPGGNLAEFDPEVARWENHLIPPLPIEVGNHLPTDDWVHLALQLRADGEVSAHLNGELAGRFPVRVRNDPDTHWRIGIFGHSVDTEGHVRNLAVWPGMRYE